MLPRSEEKGAVVAPNIINTIGRVALFAASLGCAASIPSAHAIHYCCNKGIVAPGELRCRFVAPHSQLAWAASGLAVMRRGGQRPPVSACSSWDRGRLASSWNGRALVRGNDLRSSYSARVAASKSTRWAEAPTMGGTGRNRWRRPEGGRRSELWATSIPSTRSTELGGGDPSEEPAEERPVDTAPASLSFSESESESVSDSESVALASMVDFGDGDMVDVGEDGDNGQAAYTFPPASPTNDTLIPSGDLHLVSDILEIAGNSIINIPLDISVAAPATEEEKATGAAVEVSEAATVVVDVLDVKPVSSTIELAAAKPEPVYGEKNSGAMITELVAFTLPLLIVWLSNPLMSLVDTAVVGAQSSVELAALGPGTSLCDNVAYMCGFLAQVTTNLVASALASGDILKADRATRTGMFAAVGAGLTVSYSLVVHGKALLKLFLGGNSAVSVILPYSCSYVYIRALGFVAVTVSMVLQGAYLARKDVATPIKSIAGASVVNLVLDCVAVFVFGMGIKGAALSTTIAQWAGLLYLVQQFWPDLRRSGAVSFLPYRQEMTKFMALGMPTCLALSGQVATCIALTVAASGCDTVALAAHQVVYGVFLLFCPIGEAVSQTVQTYLPGFTVKRPPRADGKPRKTLTFGKSAVRMVKMISAVALGLGVVNAGLAALLTAGVPSLFTPDRAVWAAMRSLSPLCGLSLGLQGVSMALQGTMMATREVYPTAAIYAACSVFFSTTFVMMRRSPSLTLTAVWGTFVWYQIARCAMFAATVGWSHRASMLWNASPRNGNPQEAASREQKKASATETRPKKRAMAASSGLSGYMPLSSSSPVGAMAALSVQGREDDLTSSPVVSSSARDSWPGSFLRR